MRARLCGLIKASATALSFSGVISAQSLLVWPSQDLAGDDVLAAATGDQDDSAIAAGGGGYLVAWADSRARLSTHYGATGLAQSGRDIWVRRLDAAGQPIDGLPWPLDIAPGDDTAPEVAWNGQTWLVTWVSQAPLGSIYSSAIVGLRVTPAGDVLDPEPIVVLGYPSSGVSSYALTSNGLGWVVVAQGSSAGSADTAAVRVAPSGVVLDPIPVPILPEGQLLGAFDLAHAGSVFLLVWSDTQSATGWDVLGLRFDGALQVLDPAPLTIAATAFNDMGPDVTSNGTQFLVGFERSVTSTFQADIQVVRVTPAGSVLDPVPIAVTPNLPYGNAMATAVVWDGTQWYASWNYAGLYLARIAADGSVLDFGGFAIDPSAPFDSMVDACLAGGGSGGVQLAWTDTRAGSYEGADVYGSWVDGPTAIGQQTALSTGASAQLEVDLATDGVSYVAVYRSEASGTRRILAERLDASGAPLDREPIVIAEGLFEDAPSVAYTNGVWLVVWSRTLPGVAVYARRMASDGTLLDAAPILVGNGYTPEVAGTGDEFLVVWTRPSGFPELSFPNTVRVRASDGAVLGPPLVINSTYARVPDVCVLGGRWLLVWQRNWSHNNPWADVMGAFLNVDGSLDSTFYVGGTLSTYNYLPRVSASLDQALIVWQSGPGSGYARRVLARRLRSNGTFPDAGGFQVTAAVNPQQVRPAVAWDGSGYVVVFEDTRAASVSVDERTDIYATRVDVDGSVLDPTGIALEVSALPEHSAAVIGRSAGEGLFGASILRPESPFAAYRIGVRTFDSSAAPVAYCTSGTSASGCQALLSAVGTASASASSGFMVDASTVEGGKDGLLFYAQNGRQAHPWGNGTSYQCVAPPVKRGGLLVGAGTVGTCAGAFSQDLNARWCPTCPKPAHAPVPGVPLQVQLWYRDPLSTSNQTTSLSNALEVNVDP